MINCFYSGMLTVQFPGAPAAGYRRNGQRMQPRDFSMGGALYLYDRGVTSVTHSLRFSRLDAEIVDAAAVFFDYHAAGGQKEFVWFDESGDSHQVKMVGPCSISEPVPDRYTLAVTLEEAL